MRKLKLLFFLALITPVVVVAREYHVSVKGSDKNDGSASMPYKSISAAAQVAQPGDVIIVHAGTYRERVTPPRGGKSDKMRIIYRAAEGEKVEIKGSEIVTNWVKVRDDTWKVTLPNSFFGSFNPYSDLIHGDWFDPKGRQHHTGAVYLNGDWLTEAANLNAVLQPAGDIPLWYGQVDQTITTIWAQFKGTNPNAQLVEINVRQTVFYPDKPGMNYITVRGFIMRDAATPWAPPTAEQIGLIGTHWSKDWIIENNVISYSVCSGIALGKYGDEWDNKSANSAEGYVNTIERALKNGWNKETIGHHIIRNNTISHCEQTGIVGSLGATFSTITGNTIHDIHVRQLFGGAEMAGIKFHGAIDVEISRNHIYRTCLGLWLDWMAQGTHVSGNLFHDNVTDLFVEVDHGPFLVDNNIFLSSVTLTSVSQGGAYVHNLIAGEIHQLAFDGRMTPFHKAHSTEVAGLHDNPCGDDRFYNNLFVQNGDLSQYDTAKLPMWMNGNVFLKGAKPSKHETEPLLKPEFDPKLNLVEKADGFYLELILDKVWSVERTRKLVTTDMLGKVVIPNLPYEHPDGSLLRVDTDYFGKKRNEKNPSAGPFENSAVGKQLTLKVW
jgi:alpha-N-arabinofuranosidase